MVHLTARDLHVVVVAAGDEDGRTARHHLGQRLRVVTVGLGEETCVGGVEEVGESVGEVDAAAPWVRKTEIAAARSDVTLAASAGEIWPDEICAASEAWTGNVTH